MRRPEHGGAVLFTLYRRDRIRHFLVWLAAYLLLSVGMINLGAMWDLSEHAAVLVPLGILAVVLTVHVIRTGISSRIGLTNRARVSPARMWFYLPLVLLVCFPLVAGIRPHLTVALVLVVAGHYLFSGYLEEVLFRGLLLHALLEENRPVRAVVVSSLTFGVGHAFSLLVGQSHGDTVLQIINATIVGLVFTLVVIATGNLSAVIVAHVFYNIIARFSQVPDTLWLIAAGLVVLAAYGSWLVLGLRIFDRGRWAGAVPGHRRN